MLDTVTAPVADTDAPLQWSRTICSADAFRPLWHVVATEWQAEEALAALLRAADFPVFAPKVRIIRPGKHGSQRRILVPAFPGYLFVLWDPTSEGWKRIRSMRGAAGILHRIGAPESPVSVPQAEMDSLLAAASKLGILEDRSVRDAPERRRKARWHRLADMTADERVAELHRLLGLG